MPRQQREAEDQGTRRGGLHPRRLPVDRLIMSLDVPRFRRDGADQLSHLLPVIYSNCATDRHLVIRSITHPQGQPADVVLVSYICTRCARFSEYLHGLRTCRWSGPAWNQQVTCSYSAGTTCTADNPGKRHAPNSADSPPHFPPTARPRTPWTSISPHGRRFLPAGIPGWPVLSFRVSDSFFSPIMFPGCAFSLFCWFDVGGDGQGFVRTRAGRR